MPVSKRVVVTGLGVVSPIGIGADVFWKAALAGRSGISALPAWQDLPELPLGGYRSQVAGQVLDFDTAELPEGVQPDRYDRYAQLALLATKEAVADSGLRIERENPHRVGVIMGAGMGGMLIGEEEFAKVYMEQAAPSRPPQLHPDDHAQLGVGHHRDDVRRQGAQPHHLDGVLVERPRHRALARARSVPGQADVVITGGAEASLTPLAFAGFCALRALSTAYNDQPTRASRPFERARDGFVMGEGAATLILESLDHAIKRKAPIYAEVAGYAATSEAFHMVVPKEDGSEMAMTMSMGLRDAGMKPSDVDYINAHATVHAHRRPRGGHGHPHGLQEAGRSAPRQRHQVADRPHPRRGGGARRRRLRHGAAHRARAPHRQLRRSRPGVRLAGDLGRGPGAAAARGPAQRLRLRQQQCGGGASGSRRRRRARPRRAR